MTSHDGERRIDLESSALTSEEKETTLEHLSAIIESADPPAWAGLPLPEKKSAWQRFKEYLADTFL